MISAGSQEPAEFVNTGFGRLRLACWGSNTDHSVTIDELMTLMDIALTADEPLKPSAASAYRVIERNAKEGTMGFHHTAVATRDLQATHKFYSEAMGFELVKLVANPTESGGWAKHAFYEISKDEYIAFWDLHDESIGDKWSPALSTGMGLPIWVNHIAFRAADLRDLDARRRRWNDHGLLVHEINHGWCQSIYTVDPNGILVEFCTTTHAMTAADREEALQLLTDPRPRLDTNPPQIVVHQPTERPALAKAG